MASTVALIPGLAHLYLFSESPSLVFLEILQNGSILFAKPRSEERKSGTGETFVGDHQESDLDAMGSLLLWVSRVVGCAGRV